MLKIIREFYESIKNNKIVEPASEEPPITHTMVFHKNYPRFPSIKLPGTNKNSDLERLLELRKSTRNFSDESLRFEDIAKILKSCRIIDDNRSPEKRTYPSGGARFPVEIYFISYNVRDLKDGAYHYDIVSECLELILEENLKPKRRELISPYLENPAATIVLTSIISRSEVKYGARAYPYSLLEAGHMGQNIYLICAEQKIGCCSVSGFVDDTIKEILDLTDEELPIYTISIGRKKNNI